MGQISTPASMKPVLDRLLVVCFLYNTNLSYVLWDTGEILVENRKLQMLPAASAYSAPDISEPH